MEFKKKIFWVFSIYFLLTVSNVFSQNQWSFLRGYLDSSVPNNNNFVGVDVLNPLNLPSSREHCGSGIFNNKIWIFGGEGNSAGSDIWYYDIGLKSWAFESNRGPNEVFTSKNIESTTAHPGNRSRMASAMDKNGNFWIFGGETKDLGFHTGWNDLWKFNTATKNWTWLGGSTTHSSAGSYNITGTPDWPRARYRERGWFDKEGNFWIFGGLYYDGVNAPYPLNDMWKYNVSKSTWTCETGDCNQLHPPNTPSGNYPPTVGQTSTTYLPRGRGDYGYWVDDDGYFWLFGGFNGEVHSPGTLAMWDTWKYNTKTHEWTLLTLEDAPSSTSPGWQAEPMCWLGNDGLPWMRLPNRSIWKFNNDHWENKRFESAGTWEPAVLIDNKAFSYNSLNQPGSQFTTFNHIKTDSAVFLFNGYGLGINYVSNFTGALWKYSLDIPSPPNIELTISNDDFVANGASPYSSSNREVTLKNLGQTAARNVVITVGLSPQNNYSAMKKSSIKLLNSSNQPFTSATYTTKAYVNPDLTNASTCLIDSTIYKSSIEITIPKISPGEIIKISSVVDHCMANFNFPTNYHYSWNYWGAKASFKDEMGRDFSLAPVSTDISKTLDSYRWSEYKAPLPSLNVSPGSKLFTLELGSGTLGSPSNNQDLGPNYPKAQARIDLTLPQGIFLTNGSLTDIVGEYAVQNGSSFQLYNVSASSIEFGFTKSPNLQSYIIKFPTSRYLPIRRVYIKLRANSATVDTSPVKAQVRTTFNSAYATMDYGWKPASQ